MKQQGKMCIVSEAGCEHFPAGSCQQASARQQECRRDSEGHTDIDTDILSLHYFVIGYIVLFCIDYHSS